MLCYIYTDLIPFRNPACFTLHSIKFSVVNFTKDLCVILFFFSCPAVPPSIRDSSGDSPVVISVRVGKSVTLECHSNAIPPPTITWYKNGRLVAETANLHILANGQTLEMKGTEVCVF